MAYVSRDPFARTELHRSRVASPAATRLSVPMLTCDECGASNCALYTYGVEHDGVSASYTRRRPIKGKFCSKSCFNSYHS